ncbi:unnamed protein product [Lampetra fluviatilis]
MRSASRPANQNGAREVTCGAWQCSGFVDEQEPVSGARHRTKGGKEGTPFCLRLVAQGHLARCLFQLFTGCEYDSGITACLPHGRETPPLLPPLLPPEIPSLRVVAMAQRRARERPQTARRCDESCSALRTGERVARHSQSGHGETL